MTTSCHSYEDGVAGQFKKILEESNTNLLPITLSYGNNGPLMQLGNLIEYNDQLSPKIVLWVYYDGNDISDLNRELKTEILTKYLFVDSFSQNLAFKQEIIDRELKSRFLDKDYIKVTSDVGNYSVKDFFELTKLRDEISYAINFKFQDTKKNEEENFDNFKKIILKAKKIVDVRNSDFYFVYLPSRWDIDDLSDIDDKNYLKIINFLKTENIKLIDFNNLLKSHPDPKSLIPFRTHGHFNKIGVTFFVNHILSKIEKNY